MAFEESGCRPICSAAESLLGRSPATQLVTGVRSIFNQAVILVSFSLFILLVGEPREVHPSPLRAHYNCRACGDAPGSVSGKYLGSVRRTFLPFLLSGVFWGREPLWNLGHVVGQFISNAFPMSAIRFHFDVHKLRISSYFTCDTSAEVMITLAITGKDGGVGTG